MAYRHVFIELVVCIVIGITARKKKTTPALIAGANNRNLHIIFLSTVFLVCVAAGAWYDNYLLVGIPFGVLLFFSGWKNLSTIVFLLLITLPLSTEWQITPELGTDFPDEFLMLMATGLVLLAWLYAPGLLKRQWITHPLMLLLIVMFSWAAITVLSSAYPVISIKFILAKSWYIGSFVLAPLAVFKDKKNIKTAMVLLAAMMLIIVVITLCRHAQYGFSFVGINDSLRPFFRNHVNYSAMLVCLIPGFFAFYSLTDSAAKRTGIAAAIVILMVALFFSYARGAWLALLIGLAAYWLMKRRLLLTTYIVSVVLAIAAVFWLGNGDRYLQYAHNYRTTIFHPDFQEHLRATYQLKDLSTAERFYRWIAGVRMIKEHAVTGFGPNTFYNNYKPYTVPAFKTWVSDNKEHSTVHNYFLLTAIEQGIPGLLFFLVLVGAMIYYAQNLYHSVNDRFYRQVVLTVAMVLCMILTVNSLSDLIETDKIGSLFFLCLSLLIITDVNHRRHSSNPATNI